MNEEKCKDCKKMIFSGIKELGIEIETTYKKLLSSLDDYKALASIDDLDISLFGETTYSIFYKSRVKLTGVLEIVLYYNRALVSMIKMYRYLVETCEKLDLYRVNKESLIMDCLNRKIKDKDFRETVPYNSYKEFDELEIDALGFMLSCEVYPPDIDFVRLQEILEWISDKYLLEAIPEVPVAFELENSFLSITNCEDLKNYLESKILQNINVNKRRLVDLNVARLKSSENFTKYLSSSNFALMRDLNRYESAAYKTDFLKLHKEYQEVKAENRNRLENIDFIEFDINDLIADMINFTYEENTEKIEIPMTRDSAQKTPDKMFKLGFLQKCNKYLIFDIDTLNFMKDNSQDENEREIIDYVLTQKIHQDKENISKK